MQTQFQEKKKQQSCIEITWIMYIMELIHCLATRYNTGQGKKYTWVWVLVTSFFF
jgi:hypothetical protein